MPELLVRDLALPDRAAALDVRHRSFGPLRPGAQPWWEALYEKKVGTRRALGVFSEGVLVATARFHEYRQVWGGRALPMAGVAGVVVAPEFRGQGVATLLMKAVMERAVELGDVVSVLFPAAIPPYRRLGWELAGAVTRTTLPAEALRRLAAPPIPVRRASGDDVDEIVALMRRVSTTSYDCGPLELTPDDVRELIDDPDNFCYVAADGVLVYAWDGSQLRIERLVAQSPETTRALWSLAGSGASVVNEVYTYQPAHDPIHWICDGKANLEVREDRWMLRLLDASAAIAGRGFPAGVTIDVALQLEDRWLVRCAGSFRLRVSGGAGSLSPEAGPDPAAVRLGPNGLAALYAGTPVATLRAAGLISGGTLEDDALLGAAFAARPYLIDSF